MYPGDKFEAYNKKGEEEKTKIKKAEDINNDFEGVGAIPLTPEKDDKLREVIRHFKNEVQLS
ncbi:MAG: hypothetical protein ABH886_08750 [Candidatus Desantisbacteria bacterium]